MYNTQKCVVNIGLVYKRRDNFSWLLVVRMLRFSWHVFTDPYCSLDQTLFNMPLVHIKKRVWHVSREVSCIAIACSSVFEFKCYVHVYMHGITWMFATCTKAFDVWWWKISLCFYRTGTHCLHNTFKHSYGFASTFDLLYSKSNKLFNKYLYSHIFNNNQWSFSLYYTYIATSIQYAQHVQYGLNHTKQASIFRLNIADKNIKQSVDYIAKYSYS